jgi:hypothetical protein
MIGVSVLVPTELLVAVKPGGDRSAVSGRLRGSGVRGSAGRGAWIGATRVVRAGRAVVRIACFWRVGRTLTGGSAVLLGLSGGDAAPGEVFAGVVGVAGGVVEGVVCADAIGQSAVVPNATARNIVGT